METFARYDVCLVAQGRIDVGIVHRLHTKMARHRRVRQMQGRADARENACAVLGANGGNRRATEESCMDGYVDDQSAHAWSLYDGPCLPRRGRSART